MPGDDRPRPRERGDSLPQTLARWLALSLVMGGVIGALLSAPGRVTLGRFLIQAAISALYAGSVALPVMLLFRALGPWLSGRPRRTRRLAYVAVLAPSIAVGTLVAGLVLVALDVAPIEGLLAGYRRGLQIALAVAVPVTLGAAAFSRLRARLARTEASLRDKELEHQRALAVAAEARLAALESRVRPHFLFNALNSAIALIPEDPGRAEQLLVRLAGLLRVSLDAASATLLLGDELRVVADYLEIERVRFGDRLHFAIDVPGELEAAAIPAFAVQTLVENSVKYAVSARKAGARIAVRARRDADQLRIEVTDDGPGFTGPIWRPGHGLDALRARLDALYGPAARLIAPLALPAGAGVAIELPAAAPEAPPPPSDPATGGAA